MRTLARIAIGLAVVLVLLVAGAIVALQTVDPNTLIAPVQARVKALTGRDLTVRGEARIALSLHPRIVLTNVVLGNATWGIAKELATVERLELAAALIPLLSRRFELEEIVLEKPVVALETDGKGARNWQPASPGSGAAQASPATGGDLAASVSIDQVTITQGTFTYRDGPNGAVSRVAVDRLAVRARALGSGVALEFRGTVGDAPLTVEGTVGSIGTLLARTSPYPVDVKGQIAGQPFAVAASIRAAASRYAFDDLKLALGENAITGSLSVDASGARPKFVFDLAAAALVLKAVSMPAMPHVPASAAPAPGAPAQATRAYLIPNVPVSFAPLRLADADGKLAIGKLTLASGQALTDVQLILTSVDGKLDVTKFSLGAFGGSIGASARVDAGASVPALILRAEGNGLSLGAMLTALGRPRDVQGGTTQVSLDLAMRGNSPHEWASTATGSVRAVAGRATLVNNKIDPAVVFDKLNEAINPFRTRDPSTDLVCAVVRFPISDGIAHVDRSIAMETNKLGVSASGTLDFRNETLDFQFNPKVRKGISIDFAGLADVVRVTGPFASPHVGIDPVRSAKLIASVGAAIGTSGLSAVAQGLLSWADGSGPGPCQIALEGSTAHAASPGQASQAHIPIANELGKALGKLFGR